LPYQNCLQHLIAIKTAYCEAGYKNSFTIDTFVGKAGA
jgi:hypothetical protein